MRCRAICGLLAATLLVLGLVPGTAGADSVTSQFWSDISSESIAPAGARVITPDTFRALALNRDELAAFLALVPEEGSLGGANRAVLALPLPDGGFGRFSIVEEPILAPELGALFPEIRTYAGYGLDDGTATVRLDLTPAGFHAAVLSARGSFYIDPFQMGDVTHYQSYYKRDYASDDVLGGCTIVDEDDMAAEIAQMVAQGDQRFGTQLRTYRAAVAATGEYTQFHGGTVAAGLAAVTTSMNRVVGVYEREVSIRMELVPNNNLIIYTNPSTDPYTNNNGSVMLNQNQANLDAVIGNANYDIGHVFSTGGGGIAGLGVVCRTGLKARGVTGLGAPVGDPFDIDYVAHEMGHQYGGNHCFNGNAGSCAGSNRNPATAYEPGSGSTVMAYAGICGAQNLQQHSDDYFVWISQQEIVNYTTGGYGNACPVTTATGAVEPTVNAGSGGFAIPRSTPFVLTGSATTTGTPTYCWEESDLGPAGHPSSPVGNAPIFRSFDPVENPTRTFPKVSDLLFNTQTIGEILPSYTRNLTFRLTVRDFQAGGVGVGLHAIGFTVDGNVGPFMILWPSGFMITVPAGSQQTVTWNVAGTTGGSVNCSHVNIRLSIDGGYTWPYLLVANTPNDGSQQVTIPNTPTTTARVKVEAVGNVFFDISNQNFEIESSADVAAPMFSESGLILHAARPNPFSPETLIRFEMPQAGAAALRIYDAAGRVVRTLIDGEVNAGTHQAQWDGTDDGGNALGGGIYLYKLSAMGETLSGRMTMIK